MTNAATCLFLFGLALLSASDAWSSAAGAVCIAGAVAIVVKTSNNNE